MLTQIQGEPKVSTKESGLPKCVRMRLAALRAAVDDVEAARANLQKRMSALRPDESYERSEVDRRLVENNKRLSYARTMLNRVDQWLKASGALHHASPTPLKEAPGVKVGAADWGRIENLRAEVDRIKQNIADVQRAPLPFSMIEAQLKITVNKWASEGEPRVEVDQTSGHANARWGAAVPASYKIMAWLHKDAMLARLVERAKKEAAIKGDTMSPEQKADALKSLRDRLQAVEREEVSLIDALRENNPDIQHRLNVSEAALLGVVEPRGLLKTALVA